MAKLVSRIVGWFRPNTMVGIDKSGNRYFTRTEDLDGFLKERRSVKFKSDSDPTTLPVEWISWLTGRRKEAPTPQEMLELEAQRERVKMNASILQKEEEKRRFRAKSLQQSMDSGDVGPPDLARFIQDFSDASIAHGEGFQNQQGREVLFGLEPGSPLSHQSQQGQDNLFSQELGSHQSEVFDPASNYLGAFI